VSGRWTTSVEALDDRLISEGREGRERPEDVRISPKAKITG